MTNFCGNCGTVVPEGSAVCPNCGIDSIIPDSVNEVINEQVLDDMNKYWF